MGNMEAWEVLLVAIGFEILSLPLIIGAIKSILDGYYKAKEAHEARKMKALSDTIEKVGSIILNKINEREKIEE